MNRAGVPITVTRVLKEGNLIPPESNEGQELHRTHRRGSRDKKSRRKASKIYPENNSLNHSG